MGRPSDFTQELADRICSELADGRSLRGICAGEDFPSVGTVLRWVGENKSFQEQYARAREIQAETHADAIVSISDGPESGDDSIKTARDRLRVDSRKWVASKLLPKKYGDKVALTGGGEGDNPILVQRIERVIVGD